MVHLMPVARLRAAGVFCGLFLWLGLRANLSTSKSTQPGRASASAAGDCKYAQTKGAYWSP